jgi:hypothetical protein
MPRVLRLPETLQLGVQWTPYASRTKFRGPTPAGQMIQLASHRQSMLTHASDNVILLMNEGPASHANFSQKLVVQDFSLRRREPNSEVSTLDLSVC